MAIENGPFWRCIPYWTWGFSIAMLVYQRVINHLPQAFLGGLRSKELPALTFSHSPASSKIPETFWPQGTGFKAWSGPRNNKKKQIPHWWAGNFFVWGVDLLWLWFRLGFLLWLWLCLVLLWLCLCLVFLGQKWGGILVIGHLWEKIRPKKLCWDW